MPKLLTTNTKLEKDSKKYLALGLQLAPHKQAGMGNLCPNASKGCVAACLYTSGFAGIYKTVNEGRIKRTQFFFNDRKGFMDQLFKEICSGITKAKKDGRKLAVRLNTISDIAWERIKVDGKNIFEHFPQVIFYDYTKSPQRMTAFIAGELPKNYHLTFSRSESNDKYVDAVIASGGNVAAVFRGQAPKTWKGRKTISGDQSDLRFRDPKGVIVALVEKGLAKKDQSGFVLEPN